jgi:hypothetical protein
MEINNQKLLIALLIAIFAPLVVSASMAVSQLVDFWDHASRTTFVGLHRDISNRELSMRRDPNFQNRHLDLDFEFVRVGSFSLAPRRAGPVTLITDLWGKPVLVPANSTINFYLRPRDSKSVLPDQIEIELREVDRTMHRLYAKASASEDGWVHFSSSPNNLSKIELASISLLLPGVKLFWIDGVHFNDADGELVGVTDLMPAEWQRKASQTRDARVIGAIRSGASLDFGDELRRIIDQFLTGEEPTILNLRLSEILYEELQKLKNQRASLWSLTKNLRLFQLYFELGSTSSNPLLDPENQALLLKVMWERLEHKNDIGWARSNTWWMTGSENHDLNAKISCLLSSRIFMDEPDYSDRIYPNKGLSPGYGYWFHINHGDDPGYGPSTLAPWGPANGEYRPADHYREWVRHLRETIAERTRRGFFLENASSTYQRWTLGFLCALRSYCGDESLHRELSAFFDLIWADWAQEQISGLRGGPKTRHHHSVGGYDAMTDMARFYLGGPLNTVHTYSAVMLDDYYFPEWLFNLSLDTRGRGVYEIVKRGIGEEETTRPRPSGTERTMLTDVESRLLKYSWVTPYYILGTQMDHPDAVHSHLSATGRWHGLIVGGSPATRIVPTAGRNSNRRYDLEAMWLTAQHRNVLIGQQARRWHQISPEWYPAQPIFQKPVEIHIGKGWDEIVHEAGWIFLRKGAAYAAVREVLPRKAEKGTGPLALRPDVSPPGRPDMVEVVDTMANLNDEEDAIVFEDMFNPFIIHAGDKDQHGSFIEFREAVLDSLLELGKTVVPGFYTLHYAPSEDGNLSINFPAATPSIPLIGGNAIDYLPNKLFQSPFINSYFGSGHIRLNYCAFSKSFDFPQP